MVRLKETGWRAVSPWRRSGATVPIAQ
jgi:hypothetical protein